MNALLLFCSMLTSAMITVGSRLYRARTEDCADANSLYNFLVPATATLGWLILFLIAPSFDVRILPYAVGYGVGYTFFTLGMLGALKNGPTSVTALVKQLALVGVSVWGFFFWQTPATVISVIGLILIVISLVLCLLKPEEKKGYSLAKWAFYAVLITIGNAGCSIIQRYQQNAFDYQHKSAFMLFGVLFSALVCLAVGLRGKRRDWGKAFRRGWYGPCLAGGSSALANTCTLILIKRQMSSTIIYPGIAVGGLILTTLISFFFFRERLRPLGWCGLAIGAVALVLLNL